MRRNMSKSVSGTPAWRKSTRSSDPELAQCVEVAAVVTTGAAAVYGYSPIIGQ